MEIRIDMCINEEYFYLDLSEMELTNIQLIEIFENDSEDYNISVSDKTGKEIFVSSCKTNDEAIQQLEKFANTLK